MGNTSTAEERPAEESDESMECAHETPASFASEREMPCPMCGTSMPDLKGGKASICPNCGFKDSCCF